MRSHSGCHRAELWALGCLFTVVCGSPLSAAERLTFNEHIRPILSDNCFACHGTDASHREANLRLDLAASALAERKGVRAVVPGDLENSEVWQRIISPHADEVMPPPDSHKPPLTAAQRDLIKRWIEQGAVYQNHWAFEPVVRRDLPQPAALRGPAAETGAAPNASLDHPIDRFVQARLARQGLSLSPDATPAILLRRVTLDLTGLPPTAAELDAFLADRRPDAYERAVDRLLGSTRYGEHFARFWLDAVRYGDTHGMHLDNVRLIWPYRDWVVRAFNRNLPFDQFTVDQLAGDLRPAPTLEQRIATGYNRCVITTSEAGAIEEEAEARTGNDRTDTTAAVWLGLTAGCASCHDHKFDPLSQREYYSLGAFFKGLADRVWDGNIGDAGPRALLADEAQEARLAAIAREFPAAQAALSAKAELIGLPAPTQLPMPPAAPKPDKAAPESETEEKKAPANPVSYEVVWAEDGDAPSAAQVDAPRPAGEWRSGRGVPVAGGSKALWIEGAVQRDITFATGEVPLMVRTSARAFIHFQPDAARPPRAVALELLGEKTTKTYIWGDPAAFSASVVEAAQVVGPLPRPGAYARLEIDAVAAGLASGQRYTALRLVQSDGAAWWDRAGVDCVSPSAKEDPLLNKEAWARLLRNKERSAGPSALPFDIKFVVGLSSTQHNEEEKARLANFFRDYIYGPTRGALEPESHAARRWLAEDVHFQQILVSTPVAQELPVPKSAQVLIRGQYDKPGATVEPGTPAFLPPLGVTGRRATRLDLAQWLVNPANPLTARVAVNRFWQQLFGTGLVRTPSDFGSQGEPPTHPELLDWLASEFVRTGWDVKGLVRLIVTAHTYRQQSQVTPALLELDPANRLLARAPRPRLDAEVLRDQALALSGLLEPTLGGPPVRPYQPSNVWEPVAYSGSNTKTYEQDHGASLYRRSLYTFWKRTAPAPSMSTFDAPSRETFCVARGRSNTPLQALALMNDVQQFEAARVWAEHLLEPALTDDERLVRAFRAATARPPTAQETALLSATLAANRTRFANDPKAAEAVLTNGESKLRGARPAAELAAWTLTTNLLLNLDETLNRN